MLLQVVIVSTRPGRAGEAVGKWFAGQARTHGKFEVELVDLAAVNLPMFDEPRHPRLGQYEHPHTKHWSETVSRGDAFVFVTPEYNYSTPPSLVNALTYLSAEWAYKAAGFASYGGVSGGLRGVEMTKQFLTALRIMPVPESVSIPAFTQYLDWEAGVFSPGELAEKASRSMLDELFRWSAALTVLR